MDEELNAKNCLHVGMVTELIRDHITPECTPSNFPLILGGDHCISIGTISAIKKARPNAAVVWVSYSLQKPSYMPNVMKYTHS